MSKITHQIIPENNNASPNISSKQWRNSKEKLLIYGYGLCCASIEKKRKHEFFVSVILINSLFLVFCCALLRNRTECVKTIELWKFDERTFFSYEPKTEKQNQKMLYCI